MGTYDEKAPELEHNDDSSDYEPLNEESKDQDDTMDQFIHDMSYN